MAHYGPTKTPQLANIHKFTLNTANEAEIRGHFQKTDPNNLKKAVKRLKRKAKAQPDKPDMVSLTSMHFFQKLMEKENMNNLNFL